MTSKHYALAILPYGAGGMFSFVRVLCINLAAGGVNGRVTTGTWVSDFVGRRV